MAKKEQSTMLAESPAHETSQEPQGSTALATLATLDSSKFLALRPGSEVAEALQANLGGEGMTEQDLIRVKTPSGGATMWSIPDLEGETQTQEIVGALVYYGIGGALWPSFEPTEGTLPVLRSDDGRTAYRVGDALGDIDKEVLKKCDLGNGLYDIRSPKEGGHFIYNDFGTGKNGKGKRWQEHRIMCILREGDAFPLMIRVKPGSLKTIVPFVKRLPVPHFRAVVGLSLVKTKNEAGQAYSQIVPRLIDKLSREEGEVIRKIYTDAMHAAVRGADIADGGE